jgi:hypothetical protein
MKKNINTVLVPPRENLDSKVSLRFNKSQNKIIEALCRKYKVRKNDLFRFILQDFVKRHKLTENGTRN